MPDLHVSSPGDILFFSTELAKPVHKAIASAGHLVERFAAACDGLQARVRDGRISLPEPWRGAVLAAGAPAVIGDGWFVIQFAMGDDGKPKMLPRLPLSVETAAVVVWIRNNQISSPEPLLILPESLNAPLWLALLRLRQLRDFWEPELRRSGLDHLLSLLPDAWLHDLAPLPPGAVIPRLEIASWDKLETLTAAGRKFAMQPVHGVQASVLMEADFDEFSPGICAIYAKKGARVDMMGFMGKERS